MTPDKTPVDRLEIPSLEEIAETVKESVNSRTPDKTPTDRLAEALEGCLREHSGYTIKGECELRARQALTNYRASKVEDDAQSGEARGVGFFENISRASDDKLVNSLRTVMNNYISGNNADAKSIVSEAIARLSCDTPAQSVGHDELVEKLKIKLIDAKKTVEDFQQQYLKDLEKNTETVILDLGVHSIERAVEDVNIFNDAITALSNKPVRDWVKIEDIPEEWKDGRAVNLAIRLMGEDDLHIMFACGINDEVWYDQQGFEILNTVTHAMLPIAPPKMKGA